MHHTIVHFDIPADDPEALADFYRDLFGWKIEKTEGPEEYWLISTGPEGEAVGGGLMRRQMPEHMPVNYIHVESVDEFSAKLQELGGKIVIPKQPVPTMGWFAHAVDPQGNVFALWEDDPEAA